MKFVEKNILLTFDFLTFLSHFANHNHSLTTRSCTQPITSWHPQKQHPQGSWRNFINWSIYKYSTTRKENVKIIYIFIFFPSLIGIHLKGRLIKFLEAAYGWWLWKYHDVIGFVQLFVAKEWLSNVKCERNVRKSNVSKMFFWTLFIFDFMSFWEYFDL